jgi:hypothetical protein
MDHQCPPHKNTCQTCLNLLYAHYADMFAEGRLREAVIAWRVYTRYCTKYKEERGQKMPKCW